MKKKVSKQPVSLIKELKCSECGKKTKHYLSKSGEYRCLICGKVNGSLPREVKFEPDFDISAIKKEEPKEEKAPEMTEKEKILAEFAKSRVTEEE